MSTITPSENFDNNLPSHLRRVDDPELGSTARTVDRGAVIDACTELARAAITALVNWLDGRRR